MKKASKNEGLKNGKGQDTLIVDKDVVEFVAGYERIADLSLHDETNIPLTVRINVAQIAALDHLAKRWRTSRSNLAGDMLEKMTCLVLKTVYKEKTDDEYSQLWSEVISDYMRKRKARKRVKE